MAKGPNWNDNENIRDQIDTIEMLENKLTYDIKYTAQLCSLAKKKNYGLRGEFFFSI